MSSKAFFQNYFLFLEFFVCLGFVAVLYFLGLLTSNVNIASMGHLYIFTGSLGMGYCAFLFSNGMHQVMPGRHSMDGGWVKTVLSVGGVAAGIVLFFAALFLFAGPIMLSNYESAPRLPGRVSDCFVISILCLIYLTFCYFYIWTKFVVRNDCVVINKGKVFYPGEKYRQWSPNYPNSAIVRSLIERDEREFSYVQGKSKIRATVEAEILLDWKKAKLSDIRELDLETLKTEVHEWFWQHVEACFATRTAEQLLTERFEPISQILAGFPVYWDGKFHLETGK